MDNRTILEAIAAGFILQISYLDPCYSPHQIDERLRHQRCATDEAAINLGLRDELDDVGGCDAAAVEDADGLRRLVALEF